MKVTKVWVNEYVSGKLLGFCNVELSIDGSDETQMVWSNLKIFQGKNGVQVGLPSVKDEKGKKDENGRDVYYPIIKISNSDEKPNPAGAEFMEHLRSEVENALNKKKAAKNNDGGKDYVTDDDCPF